MIKNNKRGISTIIATVLIVLITVAAVTILWAAIFPLLNQSQDLGCFEVANALTVDTNGEFSEATAANNIVVRVQRGANSADLTGGTVFLEVDGTTLTPLSLDTDADATGIPSQNGAKVYTFDASSVSPDANSVFRAAAAPKIIVEGEEVECPASAYVEIQNKIP